MKKISSILIILILFNFIFASFTYAVPEDSEDASSEEEEEENFSYSEESFDQFMEGGSAQIDGVEVDIEETPSTTGSMVGVQTSAGASVAIIATFLLRVLVNEGGFYYTESEYSAANIDWFSVCSLVFGEYLLFNANVYQTNESLNPNIEATFVSNIIDSIKNTVATWFQIIRLFAIGIIIVLLIFTGLRLATVDLAIERARYKEVIKAWVTGLLFIVMLPYIIVAISTISDYFLDVLWNARLSLESAGYSSFENALFMESLNGTVESGGLRSAAYFIEFLAFVIMDYKFFFKYIKRSFMIFLMVVISPIIAIIHIFNKIRGRDGSIGDWLSQYVTYTFMQPLHALLYLVFMFMANNIAIRAPLLGILFLWALSRAEKIFSIILEIDFGKISSLFSK